MIRDYFEQLYAMQFKLLDEMDNFLERHRESSLKKNEII